MAALDTSHSCSRAVIGRAFGVEDPNQAPPPRVHGAMATSSEDPFDALVPLALEVGVFEALKRSRLDRERERVPEALR